MNAEKIKQAIEENEGMLKMLISDVISGKLPMPELALLGYRTVVAKNINIIKSEIEKGEQK